MEDSPEDHSRLGDRGPNPTLRKGPDSQNRFGLQPFHDFFQGSVAGGEEGPALRQRQFVRSPIPPALLEKSQRAVVVDEKAAKEHQKDVYIR